MILCEALMNLKCVGSTHVLVLFITPHPPFMSIFFSPKGWKDLFPCDADLKAIKASTSRPHKIIKGYFYERNLKYYHWHIWPPNSLHPQSLTKATLFIHTCTHNNIVPSAKIALLFKDLVKTIWSMRKNLKGCDIEINQ